MNVNQVRDFLTGHIHRTYTMSHAQWPDVVAILKDHPVWGARMQDVLALRVRRNRLNNAIQLQLKTNKIWFSVSWHKCAVRQRQRLAPVKSVTSKRLASAMRHAIRSQIREWRATQRSWVCAQCPVTTSLQVDHKDTAFSNLQAIFLANCDPDAVPVRFGLYGASCISKFMPADANFKRRWQQFHRQHATYQLLCATCNSRKSNQE